MFRLESARPLTLSPPDEPTTPPTLPRRRVLATPTRAMPLTPLAFYCPGKRLPREKAPGLNLRQKVPTVPGNRDQAVRLPAGLGDLPVLSHFQRRLLLLPLP
jgi:hypothetical protein